MVRRRRIGFESTLDEYIRNLVDVFHEARRVLQNTGSVWTVIGDSFSRHGGSGASHLSGIGYQDAGRPPGNLLMISARLAMALQDSGWISDTMSSGTKDRYGRKR